MRRYVAALLSASVTLLSLVAFAPAASADGSCTQSTDQNTGNTITVCNQVVGSTQVNVDENLSGSGRLVLVDKGHVYLTVQVHHMRASQIVGHCKTLAVGTVFWNGFVNPQTGAVKFKRWHVQKGDQKFCMGHDHQWHKYSCNNPVRGKPFHSRAPRKSQRVSGRVHIVDYATWKAYLQASLTKHISASITVESPDHSCKATVSLDNQARASIWMWAAVKSRSTANAVQRGAASIKQQASSDQTVQSSLKYQISLMIQDSASGQCTSTSSTPPPQPQPQAPTVSIGQKNQVGAGETATVCADYNVPGNDTATLKFTARLGAYPGGSSFTVSGMGTQCTEYQAPNDADRPTSDTLTAALRDNQTGLSDNTPDDNSTPITITYTSTPM